MTTSLILFRRGRWRVPLPVAAGVLLAAACAQAASPPVISNVSAAQRSGTKLVDIHYDLADPDSTNISIAVFVSADGGTNYNVPAYSFSGDYGGGISPGTGKAIVWNAGSDWDGQFTTNCRVRLIANDADPDGFVLIPAGSFAMGDALYGATSYDQWTDALPVHTVSLSGFYMEKSLVTGTKWLGVYQYAVLHGYAFDNPGTNKAPSHPVQTVSWCDAVKWCNARSQFESRTPVYYTDPGLSAIYKSGQVTNPFVNWSATGYRLPTEAEWEKAARGALVGHRFPWGDTITHDQANYFSTSTRPYDLSSTSGYTPAYTNPPTPYTSPVGSFAANGYGLYDMCGNVDAMCWDWYDPSYYGTSPGTDPHGPTSGTYRVARGGNWQLTPDGATCSYRDGSLGTETRFNLGFRCVRNGP